MQSHAERWLASKTSESSTEPNLLALNGVHGGKFLLAEDDWAHLHRLIVRDSLEGNRNFLVESKTPVFKLFFDIDFAHSTLGLPYILKTLLPAIFRGVQRALDTTVLCQEAILAVSPAKPKKELTKTGVHLHWQRILLSDGASKQHWVQPAVDSDSAMAIRAAVLEELAELQDEGLSFSEVVDEAVLKKNGIRMLYSSKSAPCSECLAAKRQAIREHPCQLQPKAVSFWRCSCPGCLQACKQCKVKRLPLLFLHALKIDNQQNLYCAIADCSEAAVPECSSSIPTTSPSASKSTIQFGMTSLLFAMRRMDSLKYMLNSPISSII